MSTTQYMNWLWRRAHAEKHHDVFLLPILKKLMTMDPGETA